MVAMGCRGKADGNFGNGHAEKLAYVKPFRWLTHGSVEQLDSSGHKLTSVQ